MQKKSSCLNLDLFKMAALLVIKQNKKHLFAEVFLKAVPYRNPKKQKATDQEVL